MHGDTIEFYHIIEYYFIQVNHEDNVLLFLHIICVCSGASGVGLYGNEEVKRGMKAFTDTAASVTSDWNKDIDLISSTVSNISHHIHLPFIFPLWKSGASFMRQAWSSYLFLMKNIQIFFAPRQKKQMLLIFSGRLEYDIWNLRYVLGT